MAGPRSLLSVQAHLDALDAAVETYATAYDMTWPGAQVPTTPGWTVLDLTAHLGMVHRWATAAVTGDTATMGAAERLETEGRTANDPVHWLRLGAARLREALEQAPEDLDALVFLKEAPPAKAFWARRQCHETTVHALDALATQEEGPVTGKLAWFAPEVALDGVDELLVGFWQRGRGGPRSPEPVRVLVRPDEGRVQWLLEVGPERTRTTRLRASEEPQADARVTGPAVDLYLALWNRGGRVEDPEGLLPTWRESAAIHWS